MSTPAQKRARRRRVLPGFPVLVPFTDLEAVREYVAGDGERVQCLLCGQWKKSVGHHVVGIHEMSVEDYRVRYGIPWTYPLSGDETIERRREAIFSQSSPEELAGRAAKAREPVRVFRPTQPAITAQRSARIQAVNSAPPVTTRCITCGQEMPCRISDQRIGVRCASCWVAKYKRMSPKAKARLDQWIAAHPQRHREYKAAWQHFLRGNPRPLAEYKARWDARVRVV